MSCHIQLSTALACTERQTRSQLAQTPMAANRTPCTALALLLPLCRYDYEAEPFRVRKKEFYPLFHARKVRLACAGQDSMRAEPTAALIYAS